MSEQLAQLEKKGGGGTINQVTLGVYPTAGWGKIVATFSTNGESHFS